MKYNIYDMQTYNIHTIKTDKFKNIHMEILIRDNIDKDTVFMKYFLTELLIICNNTYKTERELAYKKEHLYGASIFSTMYRLGNIGVSAFCIEYLNPKYLKENINDEAIKTMFDLVLNPLVKNESFDEDIFNIVRDRIIADIESIKESPQRFAFKNAINFMDDKSISSVSLKGKIDDLKNLTPEKLYSYYKELISNNYIDVFIMGEFEEEKIVKLINKYAKFSSIKDHKLDLYVNNKPVKKIKTKNEESDYSQSQMIYLYNTSNLTEFERKYVMNVYDMILGGGSLETKLMRNVRGDNSLCYGIYSTYSMFDGLTNIITSVSRENIKIVDKLISNTVKEMKSNVCEEELNNALFAIINSLMLAMSSSGRAIDQYSYSYMTDIDPIEERIINYQKVTVEDVMNVAKKVSLNTIYVLKGEGNEEV